MALKIKCSSSEKLPHQVLCGVRSSQVAERESGRARRENRADRAAFSSFPSRMSELPRSVPLDGGRETGWNVAQMLFSAMAMGGGRR